MHGNRRRVPLVCLWLREHGPAQRHLPQLMGRSFLGRGYRDDRADVLLLAHLDPHEIIVVSDLDFLGERGTTDSNDAMHLNSMLDDRSLSLSAVPELPPL